MEEPQKLLPVLCYHHVVQRIQQYIHGVSAKAILDRIFGEKGFSPRRYIYRCVYFPYYYLVLRREENYARAGS